MDIQKELLLWVGAALVCAMVVSFIMCPLVKSFAYKIGAIDVPKDSRRMHKKPVPRLGLRSSSASWSASCSLSTSTTR